MVDVCRLCSRSGKLCRSHAIPKAFFRPILRRSGGSAIIIPGGSKKIYRSGKTGETTLFCQECEGRIDREFDKPLIYALRTLDREIVKLGHSATVEVDHERLARAIASVFWRASISDGEMYLGFSLSQTDQERLRRIAFDMDASPLLDSSISLKRMVDFTTDTDRAFGQDVISDFVLPPGAYSSRISAKDSTSRVLFSMCLQGFLVRMTIPAFPYRQRSKPGFLRTGRASLHAPPVDMMAYEPIKSALVSGYGKSMEFRKRLDFVEE